MTKLEITKQDKKALVQRLQGWSYPKLVAALLAMLGLTSLDIVVLDVIPFIDEIFLSSLTSLLGWALFWKTVKRTPTTW